MAALITGSVSAASIDAEDILKKCKRIHIETNMNSTRVFSTTALIGYMALIFYFSSLPGDLPAEIEVLEVPRTVMHIGEYAILGFLMNLVATNMSGRALKSVFYSSVLSSAYGVTDEIHQNFVPTRCFDIYDICADATGGILGAVSLILLLALVRRKASAGSTEEAHLTGQ